MICLALLGAPIENELPIGQARIAGFVDLFETPDPDTEAVARARVGDVLFVYETQGDWWQTAEGWLQIGDHLVEPASVHCSLIHNMPLTLYDQPDGEETEELQPDDIAGVVAIDDGWGLVYSATHVGWAQLDDAILAEPEPDLVDFVEFDAYVQTERAILYAMPSDDSASYGEILLGRRVSVLFTQGDWLLVRADDRFGWGRSLNFDPTLRGNTRGTTIASPLNFRASPAEDGRVLGGLNFDETLLIYGQDASGEWVYARRDNGLRGWVFAEFVELDDAADIDDLPIIEEAP